MGSEKPIEVRPAELIGPELEKLRYAGDKLGIIHGEEDLVTYALFPQVAVRFLRGELDEETLTAPVEAATSGDSAADTSIQLSVDVDGEVFNVKVSPPAGRLTEVEEAKEPPPSGNLPS